MKTIFSLTVLAASAVIAQDAAQEPKDLKTKMREAAAALAAQQPESPGPRAIVSMIGDEAFENINGYGCWCYFAESFGKGKSHPVDEMDAFCKSLHEGYECVMIDHDNESDEDSKECIPWEEFYVPAAVGETEDIIDQCTSRNTEWGTCAVRSCIVESQFVTSVFRHMIAGGKMNDENNHINGFDVEENCPTTPGNQSEKDCCGHYPFRHPFKTYGGQRDCCGAKTFDVSILKCCANGKVRVNC
jgi:hypothetical protein